MRNGKDVLVDKPGVIAREALDEVRRGLRSTTVGRANPIRTLPTNGFRFVESVTETSAQPAPEPSFSGN